MGLITGLLNIIFGGDRNVMKETAEVFRANAEEDAARQQEMQLEVLRQHGREFESKNDGAFNRFMDGINRIPRPALALGTLGLFIAAMVDPVWFPARMLGIPLVPEPLWWLLGVVVSFYFGARHQVKSQEFQRSIAQTMARAPQVAENIRTLRGLREEAPGEAAAPEAIVEIGGFDAEPNAALADWRSARSGTATK